MDSIFEKTMRACLEAKKSDGKKKNIKESRRYVKEEDEEFVDELSTEVDGLEGDGEDEVMPGVDTDIIVVVDPENPEDGDYVDPATVAQEIIDDTPEGEVPSTEEFIGDFTYTCPICGNTFFSDVEMHDGDECPVCGDTPDGYVLVGEVQATDAQEDKVGEEQAEDGEEIPDEGEELPDETEDNLEVADVDEEDEEIVDVEESKKTDVCPDCGKDKDHCHCKENRRKVGRRTSEMKKPVSKKSGYKLDDVSFNKFMNKFVRENYKNATSFTMKSAKLAGKVLTVECELKFKTGKVKNVTLKAANFNPKSESISMRDNGAFKCENKANVPFVFNIKNEKGTISCTGLRYNIITRVAEGKRVQISGNLAVRPKLESKKNFLNGARR